MDKLAEFKIGVHLMRTFAAGTFTMNCAYLGIPCVGYDFLDTQRLLHPKCTVGLGDLEAAKRICLRLKNDRFFWNECSQLAQCNYKKYFSEDIFVKHTNAYSICR